MHYYVLTSTYILYKISEFYKVTNLRQRNVPAHRELQKKKGLQN